jgi:hypothetical protein
MSGSSVPVIVPGVSFDSDNVGYQQPKANAAGGKNVRLMYNGQPSAVYVSTPLMLTWGVNEYTDEKSGRKSYDLNLQFPNPQYANDQTEQFLENMKALEAHLKAEAVTRCKEWFNKTKMSADVVDALWTPMLRYPKDRDTGEPDYSRAPTLRVKLPFWDNEFTTEIYDMDSAPLFPSADSPLTPPEHITKGCQLAAVIQSGGIWFANGKFGTTWKLFQAMIKPKATLRGKWQGNKPTADERARMEKSAAAQDDTVEADRGDDVSAAPPKVAAASDSESEEEEEAPAPVPVPAPRKVKKVVKKRVAAAAP